MAQKNATEGSRLPKLPKTADRTGRNAQVVDASQLVYLILGGMALLIAAAIAAFPMKSPEVGGIILAAFVAAVVFLLVTGFATTRRFFSRCARPAVEPRHAADPDGCPTIEKAIPEWAACLGDLLGNPGNPAMEAFCDALDPAEAETFRENRRHEAEATWQWLLGCPEYEELDVTSYDGLRLVGHVLRCNPDSNRWVVFFHGWNGTWLEGMLFARHYAERGFNMLFVEQRAHGASEGEWMGMGWLERHDVVSWAKRLVEAEGEGVAIVLHGTSMGAAAVDSAADLDLPKQVKAIVSDSGYSDIYNVLVPILEAEDVPAHPTIDVASLVFRNRRGGVNLLAVRPLSAVRRSKAPIIFMHGDKDTFVPPYMAIDLEYEAGGAAAGDGRKLVTFPHAGHIQCSLSDPERYYGELFGFVMPYVEGAREAEFVEAPAVREPILGGKLPASENPLFK